MERRLVTLRGASVALASQLILVACGGGGGDDGGVTNPPPPPPAAVATVTVTVAPTSINVGQTSQATAVLRDAQNNVLTRTVTWSSSNTAVASVNASSGVVTGVAGGTANIIATSEGRNGQAQITVSAPTTPPQISSITVTQNGQAANLAQVAGTLTVSFSLDVPAGYTGTLIVRVDTVEFHRETVSAPLFSTTGDGGVVALPLTVTKQVLIETNITIVTRQFVDQIAEIPLIRNGPRVATLTVQPSVPGGLSATQTFNFTGANPLHAHGLYSFNGTTAIGSDGKTYTGGDGVGAVLFAVYGNEVINGFEVTLTDQAAQYGQGSGGTLNVYQTITRNDLKTFTIPAAPVERPNLTYILSSVTVDGTVTRPQIVSFGNQLFTTSPNGSGFANTQQQAQGLTTPGKTFQLVTQPAVDLLTGTIRGRFTIEPFNLDNKGPSKISLPNEPMFSFLDRMSIVGGAALWPNNTFGASNNQLSANYDFAGGLRYDRLTDISGIDQSKTEFFAATITVNNVLNLFTPQFKVSTPLDLPESNGTRPYTAGARVYDKRGNYVDDFIRVSIGNQYNSLGNLSPSNSWGIDAASLGFTKTPAAVTFSGVPFNSTWNQSTIDPQAAWGWAVSGSSVGVPNGFLSLRAKFNGTYGFGAGTARDQYQIVSSTGGTTSGSANLFLDAVFNQVLNNLNLGVSQRQGLYELEFNAADNAGQYIGDSNYPKKYQFWWDYTAPSGAAINYTGTVTAGQPANGTLIGTDNVWLKYAKLGFRFGYQTNLFFGNEVYVPIARIPVPPGPGGAPNKNMSLPLMGSAPIGFWFYNPSSGIIDLGNFYRSNATSLELEDIAHNVSMPVFAPFTNSAPIPTIAFTSSVRSSIGSTNWCPGTCNGGGQNVVDLNFNFFDSRPTGTPELSKAEWFALPSNGRVIRIGAATTLGTAIEGTGRRLSYNMQFDLKKYCGPSGPTLVFAVGYNTGYYLKTNPFYSVNVQTPVRYSNECNDP